MDIKGTPGIPWGIILAAALALAVCFALYRVIKSSRRIKRDTNAYSDTGLASSDYKAVAETILEGLGGKGNVVSLESCITRLRLKINDYTEVDEKKIKSTGVAGIMRPDKHSVHIIVGKKVKLIADELSKML